MDAPKRKRDNDGTVVTFYTPDRTFQRVYKGQSLEDTKSLVRTKLGLSEDASIRFSRLHDGRHIDLEDDDDFEAFRHLARYVTTLDVSVFVGNGEPPIFFKQPVAETVPTQRKRQKSQRLSIARSEPASGRSTPSSAPVPRAPISTLDAHGVPQKKRKRREESSDVRSPHVSVAKNLRPDQSALHESEASSSKSSKKKSRKEKSPAPVLGSKRKRHDSPEASVAPTPRPVTPPPALEPTPRPSSPSSPIRKKRKKEKRPLPVDESAITTDDSSAPPAKPDKKGKRKVDASVELEQSTSRTLEASEPHGGETADTEDNVLTDKVTKKAKGEKKDKKDKKKKVIVEEETPSTDLEEAPALSKESCKKKRKRRVTEGLTSVSDVPSAEIEMADSAAVPPESSRLAAAPKKVKKKSKKDKEGEKDAEPARLQEESSSPDPAATVEVAPSVLVKRKRASKSKTFESSEDTHEDTATTLPIEAPEPGPSSVPEAVAEPQKKEKRKRRKTLSADTSVDPNASTVSSASVLEADVTQTDEPATSDPQSASTAKKQVSKSVVPGSSAVENSDSESAIAAIAAAVQAVLAKDKLTTGPPNPVPAAPEPAAEPVPELVLPTRKRKAGKSKLRQTWGPEDISVDDQSSVSFAAIQETDDSPAQPALAPSPPAEPAQVISKAAKGKKVRPSSAPSCPICDKVSLHSRARCPVVKGGAESIRKRIAQLKQGAHDEELVDELEVLLKEAQRRRKSAGDRQQGGVLAPIQVPSVAATASAESTPSPVFPLSAASFAARPAPLPRVPAGSEISEVAVESKDEGSSNESSSDDDDNDAMYSAPTKTASVSFASNSVLGADLGSIDLEALLRGPIKSHGSILTQIPSSSTTDDEGGSSDEEARQDEDVDLSEEDKNDRAYRRMSRKLERAASSSDEEHEPDAEAEDVDANAKDAVAPPSFMDVDSNSVVDAHPEQEADVEASKGDDTEDASAQDEHDEQPELAEAPEPKDATDQGYESEAEDVAAPQSPLRETELQDQHSSESESETEEPSTHRGDASVVELTADVDGSGPSHQEPPEQSDEEAEVPELHTEPAADDEASESGDVQAEAAENADKDADEPDHHASASEDDEEVEQTTVLTASAARELSPELGEPQPQPQPNAEQEVEQEVERFSSPPLTQQPEPNIVEADIDMPADINAHGNSIDLHPDEAPSDPIESLGSFADVSERRRALDDDPIEDTDAENEPAQSDDPTARASAELAGLQEGTPPPAVHRTPGTVSRMKDRYGRLGHGSPSTMLPSLSEQLLGSLAPSQPEADAALEQHDEDAPQGAEEGEVHAEVDLDAPRSLSQETQDEEADEPQELQTRPQRTTRTTRRTSARSSSILEPPASTPTPAPAPPSTTLAAVAAPKRRGRLTAEEKAAREAEKKAERDRKAAEKKAEREAKAAEKKAEKEAKEAARRAEKEAKDAAKQAAKEKEVPKRGKGRAVREKAASVKPVSTRSRAAASAETEEPARGEHAQEQGHDASGESSTAAATSTPGFSKVSWTTLPTTQPRTQTESVADVESSMVDELQPSSPERSVSRPSHTPEPISRTTNTTDKDEADVSREVTIIQDRVDAQEEEDGMPAATPRPNGRGKEPLFIPSSSQFPNTPFPEGGLPESTPYANGRALEDVSESDAEADGEPASIHQEAWKPAKTRPRVWQAPYRRLSDIASQQLFPASQIPSPMLFPASQSQTRKSSATYGHREDDDDDNDDDDDDDDDETDDGSSSGSDSEAGKKKSHIPQERRAGAGVQKKKKSLLSFA